MYHLCKDCVFSCDIDNNGVDSWLSTLSDSELTAAPAVSKHSLPSRCVISESRGAAAPAVSYAASFMFGRL